MTNRLEMCLQEAVKQEELVSLAWIEERHRQLAKEAGCRPVPRHPHPAQVICDHFPQTRKMPDDGKSDRSNILSRGGGRVLPCPVPPTRPKSFANPPIFSVEEGVAPHDVSLVHILEI